MLTSRRPVFVVALVAVLSSCSSKDDAPKAEGKGSGSGSDEEIEKADVPVEVSGAFLAALDCDVVNAGDSAATQTTFGCSLKDERGNVVVDPVQAVGAKVNAQGAAAPIDAIISPQPAGASYQFAFTAGGVKPSQAQSLSFTAVYQGKQQEYIFLVPPAYLTKTTSDLALFVDAVAGKDEDLCVAAAPCKTVARALSLIPEVIAHAVTVDLLPTATHVGDVVVENKTVAGGSLTIRGSGAKATLEGVKRSIAFLNVNGLAAKIHLEDVVVALPTPTGNSASNVFDSAVLVENAALTLNRVDLTGPAGFEEKLHANPIAADTATFSAVLDGGGIGLNVETGGNVVLRDVTVTRFAQGVSVRQGNLAITGALTIDTAFQAFIGTDSSSINTLNDASETPLKVTMTNVVTGVILNGASAWNLYSRHMSDLEITSLAAPVDASGTGILVSGASSLQNFYETGLTVAGFGTGIEADIQATFAWTLTEKDVSVVGCGSHCLFSSGGNLNISGKNVRFETAGPNSMIAYQDEQSGIYLGYLATLALALPTDGTWVGPNEDASASLVMLNASVFEIFQNEGAAEPTYPSIGGVSVYRGSQLIRPMIGASAGVASLPGDLCDAPSWIYDVVTQPVEGCIPVL